MRPITVNNHVLKSPSDFKITMGLVVVSSKDNEFLQETTLRFMMKNAMQITKKLQELALFIHII